LLYTFYKKNNIYIPTYKRQDHLLFKQQNGIGIVFYYFITMFQRSSNKKESGPAVIGGRTFGDHYWWMGDDGRGHNTHLCHVRSID
jgi:hypothetical protein